MLEAIVAIVGAVLGIVGGVLKSGSEKYAAKSAEYDANIQAQRSKENALYSIYANQQSAKTLIIVAGFLFIVGMIYFLNKKK